MASNPPLDTSTNYGQHIQASHDATSYGDTSDTTFNPEKPLIELSQKIEEKKRQVNSQAEELAQIERRIKEAEEQLALAASKSSKLPPAPATSSRHVHDKANDDAQLPPAKDASYVTSGQQTWQNEASVQTKPVSRRQDSGMPHIPGAMPTTPME